MRRNPKDLLRNPSFFSVELALVVTSSDKILTGQKLTKYAITHALRWF
jgi:hypothetical protein